MNTSNPSCRFFVATLAIAFSLSPCLALAQAPSESEFLSDLSERIVAANQGWGELGLDVAAHQNGQRGLPLRVGKSNYAKGLGHHANGSLVVMLSGEYAAFEAEVGIQPLETGQGTAIFRVYVDGQMCFESGRLTSTDEAKPVRVTLAGARELRLEANDAGDGIACDMANWANARLTRVSAARVVTDPESVNIARFARVVTWDPTRLDGCHSSRIEEFRAEDLFLETEVKSNSDGSYSVPVATNRWGCIGLQWLNRRALRQVSVSFLNAESMPRAETVRVEGWFGESAWQGRWQTLPGTNAIEADRMIFRMASKTGRIGPMQTQKIRWVFTDSSRPMVLRDLSASSYSRWATVPLYLEAENMEGSSRGDVRIYNGEWLGLSPTNWNMSRPLRLMARYACASAIKSDATVLQFRLPTGAFGVAIDDILTNPCVYLPDYRLFIARDPAPIGLKSYKKQVAGRKTILDQVRAMPDQTLDQAMAKTHHDSQREGPVMLSLACDNTKYVVERDGTVRFQATRRMSDDWFGSAGEIRPRYGSGKQDTLTRELDGGWLPIPVVTVLSGGVEYKERAYVAPMGEAGMSPDRRDRPSVCVVEYHAVNLGADRTNMALSLSFLSHSRQKQTAQLTPDEIGFKIVSGDTVLGSIVITNRTALDIGATNGVLKLTGQLAPNQAMRCEVYLFGPGVSQFHSPGADQLRREVENYWKTVLAPATQIQTPDPLLNKLILSSQVRCLIAARNEADGKRIAPWIAAMSYGPLESEAHSIIRGMDFLGHADFARRGLDFFIHRYNNQGFLTTGYTTFGTAWHLWTLAEHFQLNHDADWLAQVAPEITRVCEWIVRQTEKTKSIPELSALSGDHRPASVGPEHGLMPPGVMADWNAFAYHFCLDAYYCAALREVGSALKALDDVRGPAFMRSAEEFKTNILRAYRWTQAQSPALPLRDGAWIPAYPSQVHSPGKLDYFFPGQDAGRSWCYDVELGAHQLVPAGILDPNGPETSRMMDHMEDVQFLADGWFDYPAETNHKDWFNLGGFSKVQPYYTRNGEIYALRDEVKPFVRSYFNTIAAMLNPEILTFWEHFNHSGAWDKTHETGYFLQQTRFMLVMERGDDLWLAPLITSNWLKDGMTVAVDHAPTRFGKLSYRIESHLGQGFIEATVQAPIRQTPKNLVLRLRHPEGKKPVSVTVDGKANRAVKIRDNTILITPSEARANIRVWYR